MRTSRMPAAPGFAFVQDAVAICGKGIVVREDIHAADLRGDLPDDRAGVHRDGGGQAVVWIWRARARVNRIRGMYYS